MPHFIIHCSEDVLDIFGEMEANKEVHSVAKDSALFEESDTKVRVRRFVELSPSVTNIAMNVDEFMKAKYCNKSGLS